VLTQPSEQPGSPAPRGLSRRDLRYVFVAVVIASIVSMAGKHFLERSMHPDAAFVWSHAAGLLILIVLILWRIARRSRER
jgi:hypothetical protein